MKLFAATLEAMVIHRPSPSLRPRQHLCCDKGYDYPALRRSTVRRGYIQGQRTLNPLCRKDLHQELVAPAGDLALSLDAVL